MHTSSYIYTVLATAAALAAAAPGSSASTSSACTTTTRTATSTRTTMTTATVNPKLTLSRGAQKLPVVTVSSRASSSSVSKKASSTLASRPASSSSSSSKVSSRATSSTASTSSSAPTKTASTNKYSIRGDTLEDFYFGANSYYLFALEDADRIAVLDAMQSSGMSVARIFITHIYQNNKNSGNKEIPDLEQNGLGQYDDTILSRIDKLMVECYERNIKLIIACGDRYALGYWDTDQYAYAYGIVNGGSGAQRISDASTFYTDNGAMTYFDHRIDHIMKHKNPYMNNLPWSKLDSVVYAFEPQNEPQGHMDLVSESWTCDRAGRIKGHLGSSSQILVTSGGGITIDTSLADWAFQCDNLDIVSVHDYGTTASSTAAALVAGQKKAAGYGKTILFEEWGALGTNKAEIVKNFAVALRAAQIPWLYWQVVKPGKGSADYEVWTDENTWWEAVGNGDVTGAINWSAYDNAKKMVKRQVSAVQIEGTPAVQLGRRAAITSKTGRHQSTKQKQRHTFSRTELRLGSH